MFPRCQLTACLINDQEVLEFPPKLVLVAVVTLGRLVRAQGQCGLFFSGLPTLSFSVRYRDGKCLFLSTLSILITSAHQSYLLHFTHLSSFPRRGLGVASAQFSYILNTQISKQP